MFLETLLLSLIPSFEGRYALAVGIARGLEPVYSFIASSIGVVILSLTLPWLLLVVDNWLAGKHENTLLRWLSRLYARYVISTRRKASRYVDRYGYPGLLIFVAIPLPGTGVWTGSLAAMLLGMDTRRVIPLLILGGLLSNTITITLALVGLASL